MLVNIYRKAKIAEDVYVCFEDKGILDGCIQRPLIYVNTL